MSTNSITTGGNLNRSRISKPIMLLLFCVACVIVYFAIAHFFSTKSLTDVVSSGATNAQAIEPRLAQTSTASSKSAKGQKALSVPIGGFSQLTYQPGKQHAVRQLTGVVVDRQNKTSAWWIHPKTDEEARWMDTYGYPTAAEEVRLRAASLGELKALADAGDMNAQAHWVGRSFVSAFEKGDIKSRNLYQGEVEALLANGGPYQATTFIDFYGQLLSAYSALPEEQRTGKWVQNVQDLGPLFKLAETQLKMLGDDVGLAVRSDVFAQAGGFFQNTMINLSADSFAMVLATNARRRAEKGEPPLTIVPRPKQPPGESTFYLERQ
jgi:hypothetical protein